MLEPSNKISLTKALAPIFFLISLLIYNIIFFENKDWFGENTYQIILLVAASLSTIMGLIDKVSIKTWIYLFPLLYSPHHLMLSCQNQHLARCLLLLLPYYVRNDPP